MLPKELSLLAEQKWAILLRGPMLVSNNEQSHPSWACSAPWDRVDPRHKAHPLPGLNLSDPRLGQANPVLGRQV